MNWGEIDHSWIGKRVRVRWEEPSKGLADGQPTGIPHDIQGTVRADGLMLGVGHEFGTWFNIPPHAHVLEASE